MEGGFRTRNDSAYSCIPHGSWKAAENKSRWLTGLLPNKIGKIKVRDLVVGEVMENSYSILTKDQIFSPFTKQKEGM